MLTSALQAEGGVKQIVLLQSFERGNLVLDRFTALLRSRIDQNVGDPVVFTEFAVSPAGFRDIPEDAILQFLNAAYAGREKPDLVIAIGGPAASFALRHRPRLFVGSPLIYAAVDARYLQSSTLTPNETAVAVSNNHRLLFEDMKRLLPDTQTVFVVMGSGPLGAFWRPEFERQISGVPGLNLIWAYGLSYADIMRRAATLPAHSVIYFHSFDVDAQGTTYSTERVLDDLRGQTNAPVFGTQSAEFGHGLVGGRLMSTETVADNAADVAVRILAGTPPSEIRIPIQATGAAIFDWRELRRWNISESRLPEGSEVRFRGPTLWQDYRRAVIGVSLALALQTVLIVGLLYQRRARRLAEIDSRRNLSLATDADRRATMSALGGSIAHELSQPLNAVLHNAQAADLMVASDRLSPTLLREILADIKKATVRASEIINRHRSMLRNHEVEKKPLDIHAVVRDSVALVAADTRRREIQVDVDLAEAPRTLTGDRVLLQQVLVNLMINAMDAMAKTPPNQRRIMLRSVAGPDGLMISVEDTGIGLPAELDGDVFQPYVTTKAKGLGIGLTIVRTIVDAHGGKIEASNTPSGGATFTVTLPCA